MGFIKNFLAKRKERDNKEKEYEDNDNIVRHVEEKKKSHYERELIKSLEEERQKYIKEALHWDNIKRQIDEKIKAREMMTFKSDMFQNDNILNAKKKFLNGGDF